MALAAELVAIRWVQPSLLAPGAGYRRAVDARPPPVDLVMLARRLSNAKCSRSQTPLACQSRRRRQHVMPLPKPNSWGRSSHGIPVCRTNRMPFSATRSSTRGRPPLAEDVTTGSSGCGDLPQFIADLLSCHVTCNAQSAWRYDLVLLATFILVMVPVSVVKHANAASVSRRWQSIEATILTLTSWRAIGQFSQGFPQEPIQEQECRLNRVAYRQLIRGVLSLNDLCPVSHISL